MAKPYSMDLRERVVREVEAGGSVRTVAETFSVSPSFVVKLARSWRRSGSLAAKPQGGDRRSAPMEARAAWLLELIATTPDLTLEEIRARLSEQGLSVVTFSVWRFFDRHGISFKKNRSRRRTGAAGRAGRANDLEGEARRARPCSAGLHR